eukprot:COSAG02_NODE_1750_length_11068_cov_7.252530_7_plen_189_part_00
MRRFWTVFSAGTEEHTRTLRRTALTRRCKRPVLHGQSLGLLVSLSLTGVCMTDYQMMVRRGRRTEGANVAQRSTRAWSWRRGWEYASAGRNEGAPFSVDREMDGPQQPRRLQRLQHHLAGSGTSRPTIHRPGCTRSPTSGSRVELQAAASTQRSRNNEAALQAGAPRGVPFAQYLPVCRIVMLPSLQH